ncbi:MAG: cell surface protein [Candidatus Berkelbacteria bacterium Licking1014_96]|uniref:Cell surface protein n=1 Tax=Candidatus Berkelbacteria bacterium Licking1014_96 TaxID=2017149 RepID=A0A554LBR2_9BACT|nr:MAG: cell surface protein [Candidatus Berkelbacteria bacterium Licking1014_96]
MLKKIIVIILISFFLYPNLVYSSDSQDQSDGCAAPTGGDSLFDVAKFPMYQVFAPMMNHLTKIRLLFSSVNTPTITLTIKDMGGNSLGQTSAIVSSGWVDFTFASAVSLTSSLSYQIQLTREPTANATWNFCQPAGYGGGYAVTGGVIIPDKDYNFQTYGYGQQPAPSSQLPAAIEPPANLKAEDVVDDTGGKIKLTWIKSSTSGIDGYRIYRRSNDDPSRLGESAEAETDFTKIADVGTKFLDYEDTNLENGMLYIYVVRAIKDTSESVNSNEARARPENNLAPATPSNLHLVSKSKDFIEVAWDKVDDEKLDKYVIRWGESPIDVLTEKELSKDLTTFRAENLKSNTRYYFRLASRSKDQETSGFSDFISEMTDKGKQGISWVWILSIIVAILAGFGIYLYFAYQKKIWPFKAKNQKPEIRMTNQTRNQNDDDIRELPGKKGRW